MDRSRLDTLWNKLQPRPLSDAWALVAAEIAMPLLICVYTYIQTKSWLFTGVLLWMHVTGTALIYAARDRRFLLAALAWILEVIVPTVCIFLKYQEWHQNQQPFTLTELKAWIVAIDIVWPIHVYLAVKMALETREVEVFLVDEENVFPPYSDEKEALPTEE